MDYYVYENTSNFLCTLNEQHSKHNMRCQHYHDAFEIFFMLDGTRYAFFKDGMHRITKGDIIIIKPYILHYTESRESNYFKRYALNFSEDILKYILDDSESAALLSNIHTSLIHLSTEEMPIIAKLFDDLCRFHNTDNKYEKKMLAVKLVTLIDYLGKMGKTTLYDDNTDLVCSNQFANALNYINRNFTKPLSLDAVSEYAHISKSHFCRIFKTETGNTFLQYINNLRAAYAHSLLTETDMSIQKIAEKAGFSSLLHFERVFKSTHGVTPSSLRKNIQK